MFILVKIAYLEEVIDDLLRELAILGRIDRMLQLLLYLLIVATSLDQSLL